MSNAFVGRTRALMIGLSLAAAAAACGGTGDSFLTVVNGGAGADTVRPTVAATNPQPGATNVPTNATVSVTFSENVDSASVTNTAFTLTPGVTGTISVSGNTATFTPNPALPASSVITATVTGVKDRTGNVMATTFTFSFSTGAT